MNLRFMIPFFFSLQELHTVDFIMEIVR